MPGPMNIFDISGRAMSAQLSRLNTTASNLANARTTYSSEAEAYRAIKPVFKTIEESPGVATVQVDKVIQSDIKPVKRHDPTNPLADEEGYVWDAGVDETAELIDMLETARQYQNNVQVMQTAKSLILDTVRMGK
ncbi:MULTISPECIES: flagellar basal body rod protein FlgC [Blastomonas]|jgi:flagellar basal-body rod protein FlgC|uniref:Flagellar basal-body rod protein FlgC n=1 Tax=Blastomonas fulva TaxID=1550728 RepID=A0ABM6M494_9SPHN|nr:MULTISPECIES: flagellar basal body rod protein FlgC [Blastomonas]AOG01008.1 flagellar basal-body rod protein FlgC [Blastomonas sp. RAC04]ASR50732.1 flagellar basal body rod protein FlgC [Blastomonas fulva]KPF74190.1 flagellar basal-body rod protein FlgC [Blastomonas sp. AAP25]MCO5791826.1 flagellar basal body rod protein FlgC [Blastomonas sp.]MDK2757582.1 flagellar basal body rod protein FlgC [Blastomonas fulva]